MGIFTGACSDSKVDRIRLDILEKQLTELENWQRQLNEDLVSLQNLVDAFKSEVFIVEITPASGGYHIVLSDGRILFIRDGMPGEEGKEAVVVMPAISVRDSSDGHTYWTVNGVFLSDSRGQAIRADGPDGDTGETGETGETGQAGRTPQIRIGRTTGEWEISLDGGKTWETTGVKATGEKGEQGENGETGKPGLPGPTGATGSTIFAKDGVVLREREVEFTLQDGQKFVLPRYIEWKLNFPEGTDLQMRVKEERTVRFQIFGSGGEPTIHAAGTQGCLAKIHTNEGGKEGQVVIIAPAKACQASVLIFLNDETGHFRTYQLDVRIS